MNSTHTLVKEEGFFIIHLLLKRRKHFEMIYKELEYQLNEFSKTNNQNENITLICTQLNIRLTLKETENLYKIYLGRFNILNDILKDASELNHGNKEYIHNKYIK